MNAPIHALHPPRTACWPGSKAGSLTKHTNTGPAQAALHSQAASVRAGQNRSHPSLCSGFSLGWEHLWLLCCPLQHCLVQDLGFWCAFKPWVHKLHEFGFEHQRVPKSFFHLSPAQNCCSRITCLLGPETSLMKAQKVAVDFITRMSSEKLNCSMPCDVKLSHLQPWEDTVPLTSLTAFRRAKPKGSLSVFTQNRSIYSVW